MAFIITREGQPEHARLSVTNLRQLTCQSETSGYFRTGADSATRTTSRHQQYQMNLILQVSGLRLRELEPFPDPPLDAASPRRRSSDRAQTTKVSRPTAVFTGWPGIPQTSPRSSSNRTYVPGL